MTKARFFPSELKSDPLLIEQDREAGIDWWMSKDGLWSIAVRMQFLPLEGLTEKKQGEKIDQYSTFTVRHRRESGVLTETAKQQRSITTGSAWALLRLQGYVDESATRLIMFGFTREKHIYEAIMKDLFHLRHTGDDQIGQAAFMVLTWLSMRRAGFEVTIYPEWISLRNTPQEAQQTLANFKEGTLGGYLTSRGWEFDEARYKAKEPCWQDPRSGVWRRGDKAQYDQYALDFPGFKSPLDIEEPAQISAAPQRATLTDEEIEALKLAGLY